MISEIAILDVKPGEEAAFEAAAAQAVPLFRKAKGCLGLRLQRSLEVASRYWLIVDWETLEDHTVHFRNSADHARWHQLVRHHFVSPPKVEHGGEIAGLDVCDAFSTSVTNP